MDLQVDGQLAFTLSEASIRRRLGAFVHDGVPNASVVLRVESSLWNPGSPEAEGVAVSVRPGGAGQRVARFDLRAELNRDPPRLDGQIHASFYALEECMRTLLIADLAFGRGARGLLVHAASAVVGGRSFVFAGSSGQGKSTLIGNTPGDLALSDEHSVLTLHDGRWFVWPSPFWNWDRHFDGAVEDNRAYPLAALVFLEQASSTHFELLGPSEALALLMGQVCLLEGMAELPGAALELAGDLVESIAASGALGTLHLERGADPFGPVWMASATPSSGVISPSPSR